MNYNILQEAVDIMDRRVNGTGVSNSSVAVQGRRHRDRAAGSEERHPGTELPR